MDETHSLWASAQPLILALGAWWLMLKILDLSGGVRFKDVHRKVNEVPMAAAVYYGARALSMALVVGPVLATVRF